MTATVRTAGRSSKSKGTASAAIVTLPGQEGEVLTLRHDAHTSPTVAQIAAATFGIALAVHRGATRVELTTPSKRVQRAIDAEPGGGIDDVWGAHCAGWAIYWTRVRLAGWAVTVAKDDEATEALA